VSDAAAAAAFARVRAAAAHLPEVVEGTSYGTPSLKVRRKSFCRMKDAATLVVMCPLEEKEVLMAAVPEVYFETDHYKGWPAMLVRLAAIEDADLARRLETAWLFHAPRRLAQAYLAGRPGA
jgi:hypothetical protein